MRKFVIKLMIFFVPVVIAAFLLDGVVTKGIRKTQGGTSGVWEDVFEGKINSDIVILGSSRALNHFDPAIITDSLGKSTYNLGLSGHNFLMVKCRYDVLMKYNRKPEAIFISIDLFLLDKRKDLFEYKSLAPYITDPIVKEATKRYIGFDFSDYYLPLVRYIGYKEELIDAAKYFCGKRVKSVPYERGYAPHNEQWNGEFDRLKDEQKTFRGHLDSATLNLFEQFLSETKKSGIKVIFVYAPEYYESSKFVVNKNEIVDVYKKYSKQYGIPMLDYSQDTLCNSKDYFFNTQHMNRKGATLFSSKLAHDVKEQHLIP